MRFNATDEQVQKMWSLAVSASTPRGLSMIHYVPNQDFKPDDFTLTERGIYLDYVQGRMVKLALRRAGEGVWDAPDSISGEYESWVTTYPSYADLAKAAGVTT